MTGQNTETVQDLTYARLADDLRRRIVQGELAPASRLRQREIADHYDVSGMSARDAVKILLKDGFATQRGAKTVVVSPLSPMDFLEIMELRELLEPRALELSAPRLPEQSLLQLRDILEDQAGRWTPETTAVRHWSFHKLLYSRASRPRLLEILERLNGHLVRYMLPLWSTVGVGDDWQQHHMRLVSLVEHNDVTGAVAELRADLAQTRTRVLENMTIDQLGQT